jgi:peptidyl-prolyl cis-trans isomerase A (cyclophilin A)
MSLSRFKFAAALAGYAFAGCSTSRWAAGGWKRGNLLRPASLSLTAPEKFVVLFETTKGNFEVEVVRDWSPLGADRFYNLVRYRFFEGVRFFRVLPKFVVQFGISPNPNIAKAWDKAKIKDDPVKQSNQRGYISFATDGPDTRTTQIFINKRDNSRLDSMGFAPFARIRAGIEVVDSLQSKYGEGAPRGKGPDQDRMTAEGDAYLQKDFADLDFIKRTRIIEQTKKRR